MIETQIGSIKFKPILGKRRRGGKLTETKIKDGGLSLSVNEVTIKGRSFTLPQLKSAWKLYNTERMLRVRVEGKWHRYGKNNPGPHINASAAERITLASWYRDKGGFPAYLENEYEK